MTFDKIANNIEKMFGHPLSLPIFTVAFVIGIKYVGVDPTNIAVSYLTAALLLLSINGQRRSSIATHAKLDDLEIAVETARTDNVRLEELTEEEIEDRRKEREEEAKQRKNNVQT